MIFDQQIFCTNSFSTDFQYFLAFPPFRFQHFSTLFQQFSTVFQHFFNSLSTRTCWMACSGLHANQPSSNLPANQQAHWWRRATLRRRIHFLQSVTGTQIWGLRRHNWSFQLTSDPAPTANQSTSWRGPQLWHARSGHQPTALSSPIQTNNTKSLMEILLWRGQFFSSCSWKSILSLHK